MQDFFSRCSATGLQLPLPTNPIKDRILASKPNLLGANLPQPIPPLILSRAVCTVTHSVTPPAVSDRSFCSAIQRAQGNPHADVPPAPVSQPPEVATLADAQLNAHKSSSFDDEISMHRAGDHPLSCPVPPRICCCEFAAAVNSLLLSIHCCCQFIAAVNSLLLLIHCCQFTVAVNSLLLYR